MGTVAAAVAAVVMAGSAVLAPGASAAPATKTYQPPYTLGPAGGDEFNLVYRDESSGRVAVGRGFPGIPPVVGCAPEPSAGWATFQVTHRVVRRVSRVIVGFDGVLDPYAWASLGVRSKRSWLGSNKVQGPIAGDEALSVVLRRQPKVGEQLVIEFGLQLGDACPQIGGALATFPMVEVRS